MRTMILLVCFCLISCVGDFAFKSRGTIVDENGVDFEDCSLQLSQKDKEIHSFHVVGNFKKTIVFSPVSSAPLTIRIGCAGASTHHLLEITSFPEDFEQYIDIGRIQLKIRESE
jgi:hypothetical protein